jgi:antitoxin Phd
MPSTAHDVEASLGELLKTTLKEGPQIVSKDGVETAVLVSMEDWKHLKAGQPWKLPHDGSLPTLKDILLDPNGPHDLCIPPRRKLRLRAPVEFE